MRAIDADEAIERFTQIRPVNPKQSDYTHGIDVGLALAKAAIRDQKTIEPEHTGKWINCDGSEHWKCDKCGYRAGYWFNEENSSSWELDMSEWLSDFCPNCGAKMEGR